MINPISYEMKDEMEDMPDGILYLGIDHWPSETAKDSSEHFGTKLLPFIESIAKSDKNLSLEESTLMPEIKCAVICNNGQLEKKYKYIFELRKNNNASKNTKFKDSMKRGLLKTVGSFT